MVFKESTTLNRNCFHANLIVGNQKLKHPIHPTIFWYVAFVEDCMNGMILEEDNYVSSESNPQSYKKANFSNVNQIDGDFSIKIHPNPIINKLKIETELEYLETIAIKDIKGNILFKKSKFITSEKLDATFLTSGVYIVEILNENIVNYFKIVKL